MKKYFLLLSTIILLAEIHAQGAKIIWRKELYHLGIAPPNTKLLKYNNTIFLLYSDTSKITTSRVSIDGTLVKKGDNGISTYVINDNNRWVYHQLQGGQYLTVFEIDTNGSSHIVHTDTINKNEFINGMILKVYNTPDTCWLILGCGRNGSSGVLKPFLAKYSKQGVKLWNYVYHDSLDSELLSLYFAPDNTIKAYGFSRFLISGPGHHTYNRECIFSNNGLLLHDKIDTGIAYTNKNHDVSFPYNGGMKLFSNQNDSTLVIDYSEANIELSRNIYDIHFSKNMIFATHKDGYIIGRNESSYTVVDWINSTGDYTSRTIFPYSNFELTDVVVVDTHQVLLAVNKRMTTYSHGELVLMSKHDVLFQTSLQSIVYEKNFSIYPNPAKKHFNINIKSAHATDFAIFDAAGKQVHSFTTSNFINTIDVFNLTPGLYFIRPKYESGETLKLMIQH